MQTFMHASCSQPRYERRTLPGVLAGACLLLSLGAAELVAQTPAPIVIPAGLTGTFDLSMETADTAFPIADSANLILSVSPDGALCADGLRFSSPFNKSATGTVIYWQNLDIGLEISLSPSLPFSAFGVTDTDTATTGQLTGERIAGIATDCGQFENYQEFFALAESVYPELFQAGALVFSRQNGATTYRYYPATGITLSLSGGTARASGGLFGQTPMQLGTVSALLASNLANLPIPLGSAPQEFDDYYSGTYRMTFGNAATFSPIANGASYTFVITGDGQLCAGPNVFATPLYRAGGNGTVIWRDTEAAYYYALSLIPDALKQSQIQAGSLSFFRNDGIQYGTFSGQRTALSAECPDALGQNPDVDEINLLLDLAEQHMPAVFPQSPTSFNQRQDGYVYRHYEASGVSIRVKDRRVEGKGGSFGAAYTFLGKLDKLIELLRNTSLSIAMPSELVGTYTTTFTPSGSYSPIASNTTLDFAILANGSICLDGNVLGNPRFDVANGQALLWTDSNSGFELRLDISNPSPAGFQMDVLSLDGLPLGTFAGSKTLLLAQCAGILGGNIPVDAANTLFELAERYFPSQFPPSALTYNQFDGSRLLRYYPGSRIMVLVSGQDVSVKGGVYGSAPVTLGEIDSLIANIRAQQGLDHASALLQVSGDMQMTMGTLNLDKKYSIRKEGQAKPDSSSDAALATLMRQLLGAELNGESTFQFNILTNTGDTLVFGVQIINTTTIASRPVRRVYDLSVSFTEQ